MSGEVIAFDFTGEWVKDLKSRILGTKVAVELNQRVKIAILVQPREVRVLHVRQGPWSIMRSRRDRSRSLDPRRTEATLRGSMVRDRTAQESDSRS